MEGKSFQGCSRFILSFCLKLIQSLITERFTVSREHHINRNLQNRTKVCNERLKLYFTLNIYLSEQIISHQIWYIFIKVINIRVNWLEYFSLLNGLCNYVNFITYFSTCENQYLFLLYFKKICCADWYTTNH